MVGNSNSQTVVSISTFLMILMFIPDSQKEAVLLESAIFHQGIFMAVAVEPTFDRLKARRAQIVFISGCKRSPFDVIQ